METLLETLFVMPTETLNDWASIAESEGSKDPCGPVNNDEIKALFTKPCEDKGFGKSYFAPGINVFYRGDVEALEAGKKHLCRAYRSESTNRIVFVPIQIATANPCKNFKEMLQKVQTKGAQKTETSVPALS